MCHKLIAIRNYLAIRILVFTAELRREMGVGIVEIYILHGLTVVSNRLRNIPSSILIIASYQLVCITDIPT